MEEVNHAIEDQIHVVNFITLRRIYDVLLGIYSNINPEEADSLAHLHQEGYFASPDPAVAEIREDA